ncbi:MAG: hypothetical protein U0746_12975 [Gemmataceae bacterium]
MTDAAESATLLIPMDGWCRRVGVYLLVGDPACVAIAAGTQAVDPQHPDATVGVAVFLLPIVGLSVLVFRQAIRIDAEGVWRRRFVAWDVWPWEAFAAGAIRQGTGRDSYVYPAKSWWYRYLHLEFLAPADREAVARRIRDVWRPPPLDLPDEITARFGLFRRLTLSSEGVRLARGRRVEGRYDWADVARVSVQRLDHTRRDCRELTLTMAGRDQPVRLVTLRRDRNWNGADADVVVALLQKYVPADRFELTALYGPPLSVAEVDRREALVDRQREEFRRYDRVVTPMFVVVVVSLLVGIPLIASRNPLAWDGFEWLGYGTLVLLIAAIAWAAAVATAARRKVCADEDREFRRYRNELRESTADSGR